MSWFCKIFGHRWKCYMAFGSYCWICGKVYDSNVTTCGICGGRLFYDKRFLGCNHCHYKNKLSIKEYNRKLIEDFNSDGTIRSLFKEKPILIKDIKSVKK